MKKSKLAKILLCVMLPAFVMLGGCDYTGDYNWNNNDDLKDMLENLNKDPDYYKRLTYTYYDNNGKQLNTNVFKEAYVFVDPGKDGTYFDHKTGESVGFAELASRELTTLSQDIAYKLMSVYGDDSIAITQEISEDIKTIETNNTLTSQYKIKNNKADSLGTFEEVDKNIYKNNYVNNKYRLDDMYTLSLLSVNNNGQMADDTNINYFKSMFSLKNAINGVGFNVEFDTTNQNWLSKTEVSNSNRQWNTVNAGLNNIDALSNYLYDKILSIKTGGSNNIYSIDCLGFTTGQVQSIKNMILNDVIGSGNINNDTIALNNIIANSSDTLSEQGVYVQIDSSAFDGTIFWGNTAVLEAIDTYVAQKDIDSNAERILKNTLAFQNYLNMFEYKAYEVVVDKIVELALNNSEYNNDQLVDAEKHPLYFLYPRIAVMIVPSAYFGGDLGLNEEEMEELENSNYNDLLDKYGSNYNFNDISSTLEKFLPSWKILSIVFKPEDVYGINNVTEDRIDGVIVTDLELTFAGQEGYTSIIESTVSYVSNGNQMLDANSASLQDKLVGDACPDIKDEEYSSSHYITLVDLSKVDSTKINDYVIAKYDGFDFSVEAEKENSTISVNRVDVSENAYYNRVDGLPYDSSFVKYTEDSDGNLILDMDACLGNNYVKVDINFLEIKDMQNKNDVTDSVKRTDLNILIIEPSVSN